MFKNRYSLDFLSSEYTKFKTWLLRVVNSEHLLFKFSSLMALSLQHRCPSIRYHYKLWVKCDIFLIFKMEALLPLQNWPRMYNQEFPDHLYHTDKVSIQSSEILYEFSTWGDLWEVGMSQLEPCRCENYTSFPEEGLPTLTTMFANFSAS